MRREYEAIWGALMTAKCLIDYMVELEKNDFTTGFKRGIPRKMKRENDEAIKGLERILTRGASK